MTTWARPFRIDYPDGTSLDGVEFPSGRCVLDSREIGLLAAISLEHLFHVEGAKVVWELSPEHKKMIEDQPDVILSERDRLLYERGRRAGLEEGAATMRALVGVSIPRDHIEYLADIIEKRVSK